MLKLNLTLTYSDYAILIASLDAEWTRPEGKGKAQSPADGPHLDAFRSRLERFAAEARKYCRELNKNERYRVSLGLAKDSDDLTEISKKMYGMQSWHPFGHADCVVFVPVDDLEAAQTLVEKYPHSVESTSIAFCPVMESYRQIWLGLNPKTTCPFVDLLDVFEERCEDPKEQEWPGYHKKLQDTHPLCLFSRLRMAPLLTMGRAFAFQSLVYDLAATKFTECCRAKSIAAETVKITFLDLQEEEEIGILIFCSNYTQALELLVKVQDATLADLWNQDPATMDAIFASPSFKELAAAYSRLATAQNPDENFKAAAKKTHLFRWSRTTACVSGITLKQAAELSKTEWAMRRQSIKGEISVQTSISTVPGHEHSMAEELRQMVRDTGLNLYPSGLDLRALGTEEITVSWLTGERKHLAPTADIIRLNGQLLAFLGNKSQTEVQHLTGWSSRISVEASSSGTKSEGEIVAKLITGVRLQNHLEKKLSNLRENTRLAGLPVSIRRSLIFLYENFIGLLARPNHFDTVIDFQDVLASLEASLNRATDLVSLRNLSGDPDAEALRRPKEYVDELALQLDALETSFSFRLRCLFPETPLRDHSLDFRASLNQLILCGEAVVKSAVGILRNDVLGLDSRGGTPLRREGPDGPTDLSHEEKCQLAKMTRESIGVMVQLTFSPGIFVQRFRELGGPIFRTDKDTTPGTDELRARLAIFKADFHHLATVQSFPDFFHEGFHLIYEELQNGGPEWQNKWLQDLRNLPDETVDLLTALKQKPDAAKSDPASWPVRSELAKHALSEELFVQMMMLLFIFEGDAKLFLKDHFASYSSHLIPEYRWADAEGNPIPYAERREIVLETLLDNSFACLAAVLISGKTDLKDSDAFPIFREGLKAQSSLPTLKSAAESMTDWLLDPEIASFYAESSWLYQDAENFSLRSTIIAKLSKRYLRVAEVCRDLWDVAKRVYYASGMRLVEECKGSGNAAGGYRRIASTLEPLANPTLQNDYAKILADADSLIANNWLKENSPFSPAVRLASDGKALDSHLIVRRSLYWYLWFLRTGDAQEDRILRRDLEHERNLSFSPRIPGKPWANLLIDRTSTPLFCSHGATRRKRLGMEISVLKTLWDNASRNRARRFISLLLIPREEKGLQDQNTNGAGGDS